MSTFWVEILGKSGEVVARHRYTIGGNSAPITLGRGYDNDIIIDDPYIAANHLRLQPDEAGELWVEDQGSRNGTFDLANGQAIQRQRVASSISLTIGHTVIRIRTQAFHVAPELTLPSAAPETIPYGRRAIGLTIVFIAISLLQIWLAETSESKFASYLFGIVVFPTVALVWAGGWALLTRIVSGKSHYFQHIVVTLWALLGIGLLEKTATYLRYALVWDGLFRWQTLILWGALGWVCFTHLRIAAPRRIRLLAGVVSSLVVIFSATHLIVRHEAERTVALAPPASSLFPPFMQLRAANSPDTFFQATDALKPSLDQERLKEPGSLGFLAEFDD